MVAAEEREVLGRGVGGESAFLPFPGTDDLTEGFMRGEGGERGERGERGGVGAVGGLGMEVAVSIGESGRRSEGEGARGRLRLWWGRGVDE